MNRTTMLIAVYIAKCREHYHHHNAVHVHLFGSLHHDNYAPFTEYIPVLQTAPRWAIMFSTFCQTWRHFASHFVTMQLSNRYYQVGVATKTGTQLYLMSLNPDKKERIRKRRTATTTIIYISSCRRRRVYDYVLHLIIHILLTAVISTNRYLVTKAGLMTRCRDACVVIETAPVERFL